MGADCKSAGYAYAGSNPARPTIQIQVVRMIWVFYLSHKPARVAQW